MAILSAEIDEVEKSWKSSWSALAARPLRASFAPALHPQRPTPTASHRPFRRVGKADQEMKVFKRLKLLSTRRTNAIARPRRVEKCRPYPNPDSKKIPANSSDQRLISFLVRCVVCRSHPIWGAGGPGPKSPSA